MPAVPTSPRGQRTRAALVESARRVFERDGFRDARVVDIAREAGVATGSFYTYFERKEDAFLQVLADVREEMLQPRLEVGDDDDPLAVIAATNRAYLKAYRRNARLMELMEQLAVVDADVRRARRERIEAFIARNARSIEALQERGLADPELDPVIAAHAISAMVSRTAALAFIVGALDVKMDRLAAQLTRLWANALRLDA
jgi:AcrR family transcriptional regulator